MAAGMADSTYRRARAALMASGELTLVTAGGGRARTNAWVLRDPRTDEARSVAIAPRARVAPGRAARPLIATVQSGAPMPPPKRRRAWASRKGSGIERGIGSKPRSEPDGLGWKGSGIERCF